MTGSGGASPPAGQGVTVRRYIQPSLTPGDPARTLAGEWAATADDPAADPKDGAWFTLLATGEKLHSGYVFLAADQPAGAARYLVTEITRGLPPDPAAPARFELDDSAARRFLRRSLRRHAGQLADGEGGGAGRYENWLLSPGWDLRRLCSDELGNVEDLVHQAITEARAITCIVPGADLELLIDGGSDWMYQWRVTLPGHPGFALCSPYRHEYKYLGSRAADTDPRVRGSATALAILREAAEAGTSLLAELEEHRARQQPRYCRFCQRDAGPAARALAAAPPETNPWCCDRCWAGPPGAACRPPAAVTGRR